MCSAHSHDDVIKWKHFPRYWPFVRSPVNSPHKGQWHGALMFSLICTRINGWVNNGEAGDLRRYRAHYDVTVMSSKDNVSTMPSHHRIQLYWWIGEDFIKSISFPTHHQIYMWKQTDLRNLSTLIISYITNAALNVILSILSVFIQGIKYW